MNEYIERKVSCRDCFHYDVCEYPITEMTRMTVNECPHKFVNKADVVEVEKLTPCDVCMYSPPSSCDGKPCCMCPAIAKMDGKGDEE